MDNSISRIENALRVLAQLIEIYGDAYWPLFERLEMELESERSRQDRLQKFLPEQFSAKTSGSHRDEQ